MKGIYLLIIASLLLAGGTAPTSAAPAQPQATYELVKGAIGPGGKGSTGPYDLSSSIGQPVAGEVSAGSYTLGTGFWGGGIIVPANGIYNIYLPLVLR
ncbi:MAG TPA: hypothetical protein VLG46_03590 [Anaerolineae bacterium]|nr:hypothetical protein [Anaerolineae bacterium]